tara:strand:- start:6 stop:110 length:105 start_codon:yes stop_codon:yes gene_type:complete
MEILRKNIDIIVTIIGWMKNKLVAIAKGNLEIEI